MRSTTLDHYDLVIIGAGPSGLSAALYGAREGFKTLVLEKGIVGGMAASTNIVDNYPGFEHGVGGLELSDHLADHATRFGAEIRTSVDVALLGRQGDRLVVQSPGSSITADSVIVATGSTYKRLGVTGEQEMIGRGVHFCATCDAPLYRDKDILVVGGGNSAIQEAIFIAKFARQITMLVRGPELKGTTTLREQLSDLTNIKYHYNTEVTQIEHHAGRLTGVAVHNNFTGEDAGIPADAAFVFIGLTANTEPFVGSLDLDQQGFINTDTDFSTNIPGVFAAGDVRSGSTWQIASAIGEGVGAALSVRDYLGQMHHRERVAQQSALS